VALEFAWIEPDSLVFLLDLLAIDPTRPEYLAVDVQSTPDFSWWLTGYSRCSSPETTRPNEWVYPYPPPEVCLDPAEVLKALRWLMEGLSIEGVLKREQFWNWFRPSNAYEAARFADPFAKQLDTWSSVCQRALRNGWKVAVRVDDYAASIP
jgi:hypothetical protein